VGNFKVQGQYIVGGEPYDMPARVHAVNESSAQVQLNWLLANNHCMCNDCLDEYEKQYGTIVFRPDNLNYSMCVK